MVVFLFSIAAFLASLAAIALVFGPAEVAILTCVVLTARAALFLAVAFAVNFLVDKFQCWRRAPPSNGSEAKPNARIDDDDHEGASDPQSASCLPSLPEPYSPTEIWWFQNRS